MSNVCSNWFPTVIELVRSVNQVEVIVIGPYPGDVQIAGTEVDVIGTNTKARRIQPEPVVRVDVVPIVKPLTSPEGNLRSTFEDILHFHERFTHAYSEIGRVPELPVVRNDSWKTPLV